MNQLRIVFMGTPAFAVPSLEILLKNNFDVVAVVTAPDKPQGRGQKMAAAPVKAFALAHGIPVLQPTNLKSQAFLEELRSYQANLQIVVAFRMLPEVVWSMPALGTFNLHASLLPQYRGAAPINWAIINGEKETGVTTFMLRHEIDTGSILFQEKEPIHPTDDAGSLYERLMHKGAALVLRTTKAIQDEDYNPVPQTAGGLLRHAPKIFKENCEVDWHRSTQQVIDFVRGLHPVPGAWSTLRGRFFKILKVEAASGDEAAEPGTVLTDQKNFIHVKTADGWISLLIFQPSGKRPMAPAEYFRGNRWEE